MAAKNGEKIIFWQKVPHGFEHALRVKNLIEIVLSRTVSEISKIFHFDH